MEENLMNRDDQEDTTIYKVVVNHEEQYSIWPADRENPLGWKDVGQSGSKAECLAYVKEVWTDMRPLSLRKKMDGEASTPE
jgi:MbtH protein